MGSNPIKEKINGKWKKETKPILYVKAVEAVKTPYVAGSDWLEERCALLFSFVFGFFLSSSISPMYLLLSLFVDVSSPLDLRHRLVASRSSPLSLRRSLFVDLSSSIPLRRSLLVDLSSSLSLFVIVFVHDSVSLWFNSVAIQSSVGDSLRLRPCRNLQGRWWLIRFSLRRSSPSEPSIQSPWRLCFFKLFVPVNLIPSFRIKYFVSIMSFDSVFLLYLSLLLPGERKNKGDMSLTEAS